MKRLLISSCIFGALAVGAQAQISYTTLGGTYSENFDSMTSTGTTTPAGWFVGRLTGAISGTGVVPSSGNSTTGTNYNFGVAGVNSVEERALGSLGAATASQFDTEVRFVNNTGRTITDLRITFDGEQWRSGGPTQVPNTLAMQYSINGSSFTSMGSMFDFTSPIVGATAGQLDGNAAANRVAGISGVFVPSTPVANGTTMYLRWVDVDDASSDAGLAIDNFVFSAIPEPTAIGLTALAGVVLIFRRRR